MVRRAVSTSPESTNHHLNSHHHLSQAQTPTSSTSSLSSASDGQPVSQQPSPSSQQHSPVSVSSASGGGGAGGGAGHGNAGANAAGHGYDVIQYVRPLPAPLPGQPHVHLTPAPHGENGGHGGPAGGGIFIAAGPYAGEYYSDHSYYYPHPDYGSPPPAQHMCPVHSEYGPVTLPMVSQNGTPPMAMPMQVPHGHMMQQIVDENGTLRHVILSTQPPQPLRQGNVQHHLHPSAFTCTNSRARSTDAPNGLLQTGQEHPSPSADYTKNYITSNMADAARRTNSATNKSDLEMIFSHGTLPHRARGASRLPLSLFMSQYFALCTPTHRLCIGTAKRTTIASPTPTRSLGTSAE